MKSSAPPSKRHLALRVVVRCPVFPCACHGAAESRTTCQELRVKMFYDAFTAREYCSMPLYIVYSRNITRQHAPAAERLRQTPARVRSHRRAMPRGHL